MTEAELVRIEKAARRGLGASCAETLALGDEVRRLRAALEVIATSSLSEAAILAARALAPPAAEPDR
jgi:hypothetical protein